MTTSSYPFGWPTMSKVRRDAAAWSSASAWNVNFNNGNVNWNNNDNNDVRCVRSGK